MEAATRHIAVAPTEENHGLSRPGSWLTAMTVELVVDFEIELQRISRTIEGWVSCHHVCDN